VLLLAGATAAAALWAVAGGSTAPLMLGLGALGVLSWP
jgi:hypothetical protein